MVFPMEKAEPVRTTRVLSAAYPVTLGYVRTWEFFRGHKTSII